MAKMGDRIKELLEKKNISQKELSDMVGCTEAAISLYIGGKRVPRASVLTKIAIALDTTSDYLMEGKPSNSSEEVKYARKLIARNANQMTSAEKRDILNILLGGEDE